MSRLLITAFVLTVLSAVNCGAEFIKIEVPANLKECSPSAASKVARERGDLAFQDKSFWSGAHFYAIKEQCSMYIPFCEKGHRETFEPGMVISAWLLPVQDHYCMADFSHLNSDDGDYGKYVAERNNKAAQAAEEKRLNKPALSRSEYASAVINSLNASIWKDDLTFSKATQFAESLYDTDYLQSPVRFDKDRTSNEFRSHIYKSSEKVIKYAFNDRYVKERINLEKTEKFYKIDFATAKSRIQRSIDSLEYDADHSIFFFDNTVEMDAPKHKTVRKIKRADRVLSAQKFSISLFPEGNGTVVQFSGYYDRVSDKFTPNIQYEKEYLALIAGYKAKLDSILKKVIE